MDQLRLLTKTLNEISKLSTEILTRSLVIMRSLPDKDSDIIEDIFELRQDLKREVIVEAAKEASMDLVSDAEIVRSEIKGFVVKTADGFQLNEKACPFLAQVWHGDAYDKSEIEGLQALRDDLKVQLGNTDEETFVQYVLKSLPKKKQVKFAKKVTQPVKPKPKSKSKSKPKPVVVEQPEEEEEEEPEEQEEEEEPEEQEEEEQEEEEEEEEEDAE